MILNKTLAVLISITTLVSCRNKSPDTLNNNCLLSAEFYDLKHEKIRFKDLQGSQASVFLILSPDCPLCRNYIPLIRRLTHEYSINEFRFFGVFPGKLYSKEEITGFVAEYKLDSCFTGILDKDFILTRCLGASVTPEVFVSDKRGNLLYSGRIDDQVSEPGQKTIPAVHSDLEDALARVKSGKSILISRTEAVGCFIEKK